MASKEIDLIQVSDDSDKKGLVNCQYHKDGDLLTSYVHNQILKKSSM
jgi:hypothetical protein